MQEAASRTSTHTVLLLHRDTPSDGKWTHPNDHGSFFTRDVEEKGMKRVENVRVPHEGSTREMREKLLLEAVRKPAAQRADVLLIHRKTHRYFLGYDKLWVRTQ